MIIRGYNKWSGVYQVARSLEGDHDRCFKVVPVYLDGTIYHIRLDIVYPHIWINNRIHELDEEEDDHQENLRWGIVNVISKLLDTIFL